MSSARRRKPAKAAATKTLTRKQIQALLQSQKLQRQLKRQETRAQAAKKAFRVRKSDRGQLVFIGVKGTRNPQDKGRKGYLIHVTKSGKKRLIKQGNQKFPFLPRKLTDVVVPFKKSFRQAQKKFQLAQLEKTAAGKVVDRGSGKVDISGAWDFSDSVVAKLAGSIKKTIERQRSRRSFLIKALVLVEKSDGSSRVYEVNVPIDRADHTAIRLAGIHNFVRQKFYAYMARELAYDGLVSSGSANHIRRLGINKGKKKSEWEQKDGEKWRANESEIVKIKQIEWQILQAK